MEPQIEIDTMDSITFTCKVTSRRVVIVVMMMRVEVKMHLKTLLTYQMKMINRIELLMKAVSLMMKMMMTMLI